MSMLIHVAVAVVVNAQNQVLIALRPDGVHQGGKWEFPGGKVEAGESVTSALVRELQEELAIVAEDYQPMLEIQHDYGDKQVLLDVWWVRRFSGEPQASEGQSWRWVDAGILRQFDFPAANIAIIDAVERALNC